MKQEIPFEITYEDYENSSKEYWSNDCPFGIAFLRQFPQYKKEDIIIGAGDINDRNLRDIAVLDSMFAPIDYRRLIRTKQSFVTTIKFI